MTRNPNETTIKELENADILNEEFEEEEYDDVVMFRVRTGLKGGPASPGDC